jgi:hypothetical protein
MNTTEQFDASAMPAPAPPLGGLFHVFCATRPEPRETGSATARKNEKLSLVAVDALAPLVTFLRLNREGSDGARLKPLERNRLAGLRAIAIGAIFKA